MCASFYRLGMRGFHCCMHEHACMTGRKTAVAPGGRGVSESGLPPLRAESESWLAASSRATAARAALLAEFRQACAEKSLELSDGSSPWFQFSSKRKFIILFCLFLLMHYINSLIYTTSL